MLLIVFLVSPFCSPFHPFAAYQTFIWSPPLGYNQWHPVVATPTFFSPTPPNEQEDSEITHSHLSTTYLVILPPSPRSTHPKTHPLLSSSSSQSIA